MAKQKSSCAEFTFKAMSCSAREDLNTDENRPPATSEKSEENDAGSTLRGEKLGAGGYREVYHVQPIMY